MGIERENQAKRAKQKTNLADAFRKMIEKKAAEEQLKVQKQEDMMNKNDLLRTKLKNWEREKRNPAHNARGGEDGDIWNLEIRCQEEKDEKIRLKLEAEEAKKRKENEIKNTIEELYKRILKVEKLSEKIDKSGIMGVGVNKNATGGAANSDRNSQF